MKWSIWVSIALCILMLSSPSSAQTSQQTFAYIANSGSNNVSAFTIHSTTGALIPVLGSPFAAGVKPVSVVVDSKGRFAYVLNGGLPPFFSANISAFTIDQNTGALNTIADTPVPILSGVGASSLVIDPSGKFLYAILSAFNFGAVAGFAIDETSGTLTPIPGSPFGTGTTLSPLTFDPTGKFAYTQRFAAINQGSKIILGFAIDSSTGTLSPLPNSPFVGGSAGASGSLFQMTMDPTGKFLYEPNINSVSAFTIDSVTGDLTQISGSPFGAPVAIQVDVHPTGHFAYVVDNSCGTPPDGFVTAFTINATTGALARTSSIPAGTCPQFMAMHPTGRFAYVASQKAIEGYSIDLATGVLTALPDAQFQAGALTESFTIDPAGAFLYAADTNSKTVFAYSISPMNGVLTPIPGSPFIAGTSPQSVTVTQPSSAAPPSITSITPSFASPGQVIANLAIDGNNFLPTSTLSFGDADIIVEEYTLRLPNLIVANVRVASDVHPGPRDIVITNSFSLTATLPASFTILPPVPSQEIMLSPPSNLLTPGETNTLTATVRNQNGKLLKGVSIKFEITGANHTSGTAISNRLGNALLKYVGKNIGTDTISASAVVDSKLISSNMAFAEWGTVTAVFKMPLPKDSTKRWRVTTRVNDPTDPFHQDKGYYSIDFTDSLVGQEPPVLAALEGKVAFAGGSSAQFLPPCDNNATFGVNTKLDHADGFRTIYAHFKDGTLQAQAGNSAIKGQVLAEMGSTGCSSNTHLHFQVKYRGSSAKNDNLRIFIEDRRMEDYCVLGFKDLNNNDCKEGLYSSSNDAVPFGTIDKPKPNGVVHSTLKVEGWTLDDGSISSVKILLDGSLVSIAQYGISRPDVCLLYDWSGFQACPNIGFNALFNTDSIPDGVHTLTVAVVDDRGNETIIGNASIRVVNHIKLP